MRDAHRRIVTIMFVQVTETAENDREIPVVCCRLEEQNKVLHDLMRQFHGVLLEIRTGELFAYFPDATLAFHAAMSLLKTLSRYNLRIGLHVGEALFRQNRLQGPDVNLASRLPHCARAGGICLSRTVYQYLNDYERQQLVALGPHDLKNFDIRMPLYACLPDGQSHRSRGREIRSQFFAGLNKYWQRRRARVALLLSLTGLLAIFFWAQSLHTASPAQDVINLYVPAFIYPARENETNSMLDGIEMAVRSRLSGRHELFNLVLMSDRSTAEVELAVKLRQVSGEINSEYILSSLPAGAVLASGRVGQNGSGIFQLQDRLSDHILQALGKLRRKNYSFASGAAGAKLYVLFDDR